MKHFQPPTPIYKKDASEAEEAGDFAALQKSLETFMDENKNFAEDIIKKVKNGSDVTDELKEKTDKALSDYNGIKSRIDEMEQKMASRKPTEPEQPKSPGEMLVETDGFKAFSTARQKGSFDVEVKAVITSSTADAAGSAGALVETQRLPGVQKLPDRRMTVRDLLTPGRMDASSIEYVQETGFNNNAAMVAEGGSKPQSDIQVELITQSARVIAHHMKTSRQIMDDASQLQSLVDHRLRYGLAYKEEEQLLLGDGTGQNLHGLVPQATAFSAAFAVTSETMIDKLRLAMLQAMLAEFPATGHVLNPIDWARIELTKDGDGRHVVGVPQGTAPRAMWNLPVVETQSMAEDEFLTGAFKLGAQIFDRWDTRIEVANTNEDDFVKNMLTILAEERLAFAVYRPEAFIHGDFGNVA